MGFSKYLVAAVVALQAHGHMLLYKPERFPFPGSDQLDNGPLNTADMSTSNYPCKLVTYDFNFPRTQLPIGSNYTIEFQGQSVHGGGSCQIALTTDLKPTAQSVFKVIHSFEGGCPARNLEGNIPPDSNAAAIDPFKYPIEIPSDIPTGDYTFAWTWFNRVGNREMYMTCAPVTVTGKSTGSSSSFNSLPNLFIANIPNIGCASPIDESVNMEFPTPGSSLTKGTGEYDSALSPPTGPIDQCYAPLNAAGKGTSAFGGGSAGSPSKPSISITTPVAHHHPQTSSAQASSPAASTPSAGAGSSSAPASAASSPAASSPAASSPAASASASGPVYGSASASSPSAVASSAPAASSSSAPQSGSCVSGSISCPNPGAIVCSGSTHFGICNINYCAVVQPLAAGTNCVGNTIVKKRSLPRRKRRALSRRS